MGNNIRHFQKLQSKALPKSQNNVPSLHHPLEPQINDVVLSLNPLPDLEEQHQQIITTLSTSTVDMFELEADRDDEFMDLLDDDISEIDGFDDKLANNWTADDIIEINDVNNGFEPKMQSTMSTINKSHTVNTSTAEETKINDEDIEKISKYIESAALPPEKYKNYKTELDKLYAT